jgi:hypothetical protein
MDRYVGYLLFKCTFHNVFIYPIDDEGAAMVLLFFYITEEGIQQGMVEWPAHLQPIPIEEMDTLEMCTKCNQERKQAKVVWL